MTNIRKPILGYTVIIVTVVGLLVLGFKVLVPKQYTEVEFGMSQEDLIKLKGEAEEVFTPSENPNYLFLKYNSDQHLEYQCKSSYVFAKSFFNENQYDKLVRVRYEYLLIGVDIDSDKEMFTKLRDQLVGIYGSETFLDNFYEFNKVYDDDEIVSTYWKHENDKIKLFCSKENGISVTYEKQ